LVKYKKKQFIVTNSHVCKENEPTFVRYKPEHHEPIKILVRYRWRDLCIGTTKKMPGGGLTLAKKAPRPHQAVFTVGYPDGLLMSSFGHLVRRFWSLDRAIPPPKECIKKRGRLLYTVSDCRKKVISITTSLFTVGGASGSPVTDEQGRVVGVIKQTWVNIQRGISVDYADLKEALDVAEGN
jgi:S1-C subfamily serine protease